ncbi:hypothetical protein CTI12_AA376980 [Artemisia annua]|uniref:Uncharacterized protein n=1 Tax=Artemisia annua TaxID=35608 RepID=A0A2U1MHJ8_ARTAN|nr:hypothetical protein CTI12_AA376980 [Artemisia annua]
MALNTLIRIPCNNTSSITPYTRFPITQRPSLRLPRSLIITCAKKASSSTKTGKFDSRNKRTGTGSTSLKEDELLNDGGSAEGTVVENYEGYVLPDLPGLEKDFWEGPEWDAFGFVIEYLWAFGIVFADMRLVSSGIAVATYNEGATDFKETPAYKESIQSRDLLEEPEASSPDVFESNPTEEAPSLE